MAKRPAKRQRRSSAPLSDENEYEDLLPHSTSSKPQHRQLELNHGSSDTTLSLSPTKTRSKTKKPVSKTTSAHPSPKPSPDKSKKSNGPQKDDKTKSLHSFFGRVTEEQRWKRKSNTPDDLISDGEFGDAIEDDDLSDSALLALEASFDKRTVSDDRKRDLDSNTNPPLTTQRFVKPRVPSTTKSINSNAPDDRVDRPWADRYGPSNLEELAIHKKKAADVQTWLENALSGKERQRLLVLKGPAGSGKTTTVALLAKAMGFQAAFWHNPAHHDTASNGSLAVQFEDFLHRGGNFGTLTFNETASAHSSAERHVLVVEDFPAGMARGAGSESFRSGILRFIARTGSSSTLPFRPSSAHPTPPVVMIISETLLSSSTAFSDSFTAHRLLGPEILNHPLTTVIEFNPVAPTFIAKALDLVIKKEARDSNRRRVPGSAVLARLADMGDVRNAISSLEFLCVRNDANADWSGSVIGKPKKSAKNLVPMTVMEEQSLKLISQRETTLDMFHAAGKVVYNKRQDLRINDPSAELPPRPPAHLMHLYSPKVSEVDIEALLNETGTDIQTFVSTLHENHVLSCNGDNFTDHFESCSEILSLSDVLNPDSRRSLRSRTTTNTAIFQSQVQGGSFDALRQDEISFQVATRGLIFSLPYPVSRAAPSSGRKADSFKMFYPTSLRLWKPTEEIDALISMFANESTLEPGRPVKIKVEPGTEGVLDWKVRSNLTATHDDGVEAEPDRNVNQSRETLSLELLPYLARIKSARMEDTKTLSKITHFSGTSLQLTGDEPDEDEQGDGPFISPKKASGTGQFLQVSPRKISGGPLISPLKAVKKEKGTDVGIQNLYLEDDDIEDD
jgi:cell cycle checkpoint protein